MTPLVLAAVSALIAPTGPGAAPWHPSACQAALDPRFVHEVKPAADTGSPFRPLKEDGSVQAGSKPQDGQGQAEPKTCLLREPAPVPDKGLFGR